MFLITWFSFSNFKVVFFLRRLILQCPILKVSQLKLNDLRIKVNQSCYCAGYMDNHNDCPWMHAISDLFLFHNLYSCCSLILLESGSCSHDTDSDYGIQWPSTIHGETVIQPCARTDETCKWLRTANNYNWNSLTSFF